MKCKGLYCVLVSLALMIVVGSQVFAETGITVLMDGEPIVFDVPPQLVDDRTMVPMRKIFEVFGAQVDWDGETNTATAVKGDNIVQMQIGNPVITVDGQQVLLDVPPQLIDNRTLAPIRAVAEGLRADVAWNGDTQTVVITTVQQEIPGEPAAPGETKEPVRPARYPESGMLYGYGNDGIAEIQYNARYLLEQSILPKTVLEYEKETIDYLKTKNVDKMTENVLSMWELAAAEVILNDAALSEEDVVVDTEEALWALVDQRRPEFGLDDAHVVDVAIETIGENTQVMVVELKDTGWTMLSQFVAVAYNKDKGLKIFTLEKSVDFIGGEGDLYMFCWVEGDRRGSYYRIDNSKPAFLQAIGKEMGEKSDAEALAEQLQDLLGSDVTVTVNPR